MSVWYVDTDAIDDVGSGDTGGDGSSSNPYRTIGHVLTNVRVGTNYDIIYVEGTTTDNYTYIANQFDDLAIIAKPGRYQEYTMQHNGSFFDLNNTQIFGINLIMDGGGGNKTPVNTDRPNSFDDCNITWQNVATGYFSTPTSEGALTFNRCKVDFNGQNAYMNPASGAPEVEIFLINSEFINGQNSTSVAWVNARQFIAQGCTFHDCIAPSGSFIRCLLTATYPTNKQTVENCTFFTSNTGTSIYDGLLQDRFETTFRSSIVKTDGLAFCNLFKDIGTSFGGMLTGGNIFDENVTVPAQYAPNASYPDLEEVKASFSAIVAGVTGTVSLQADEFGHEGNTILLTGDGVKTLTTLVSDWNTANPTNLVSLLSTNGAQIPDSGQTMPLAGGIRINFISESPASSDFAKLETNSLGYQANPFETGRDIGAKRNVVTPPVYTNPSVNDVRAGVSWTYADIVYNGVLNVDTDANHAPEDKVEFGYIYGSTDQYTGTLSTSCPTSDFIPVAKVEDGHAYIHNDIAYVGELEVPNPDDFVASEDDTREGVVYGVGGLKTGNMRVASEDDTRDGTVYDSTNPALEKTGNMRVPTEDKVLLDEVYDSTNPAKEKTGNSRLPTIYKVANQYVFGPSDSLIGEAVTYTIDPGRCPLKLYTSDDSNLSGTVTVPNQTEYFINLTTADQIDARLAELGIPERIANGDITPVIDPDNGNLLALRMDR